MAHSISGWGLPPPLALGQPAGGGAAGPAGGPTFKQQLLDSIEQVNAMQVQANRAVEDLAAGEDVNPAEVLTAVQKADLAFRMMMQIRNKLVQAYQEVKDLRI
jgi:flagellar hook-basal body complex protein FliE